MSRASELKDRTDEAMFDSLVSDGAQGRTAAWLQDELLRRGLLADEKRAKVAVGYSIHRLRMNLGTDIPIYDTAKRVYRFAVDATDAELWLRGLGRMVVRRMANLVHYLDVLMIRFPNPDEARQFELARHSLMAAIGNVENGLRMAEEREKASATAAKVVATAPPTKPRRAAAKRKG